MKHAKLDGKLALVTGAGSGIGRATAIALAAEGARVVVCDVDQPGLDAVAAELGEACALARKVDVSDRAAMKALADEVHAIAPALDVLVNNAGVALGGGVLDVSLDDWDWVLRINLGGVVHGCHFFVPAMVARGTGGHVVNVSSVFGFFGAPGVIGYVTSKFGVLGLSLSLRAELAPHRIGVTAICPGMINTGIIGRSRMVGGDQLRSQIAEEFKKKGHSPELVARAIVDGIKKDRGVVPVSREAWGLWLTSRLLPGLTERAAKKAAREMAAQRTA